MINLRKPTEDDLARFKECLGRDAEHCNQKVEDWTDEYGEFMVFYDQHGNRVWVRLERVLRVHFQHDDAVPRKEQVSLIYRGMQWVVGAARNKKFTEVVFQSRALRLIKFLHKLFGFEPVSGNYYLRTVGR